jgi:putative ABC transport system permease protein
MMAVRETLSVAIDALRANKLRAILTSLGVIIGSASIVLVVTVALTSQKYVISQIEAIGSNMVYVELINAGTKGQPLSYELTVDDMDAVKAQIPGVTEVAGTRELPMSVVVAGRERPVGLPSHSPPGHHARTLFRFRRYGESQQGLPHNQESRRPRLRPRQSDRRYH